MTIKNLGSALHPLIAGKPPSWASAWGDDSYGVWAELEFRHARQRLRWIPPGEFLQGSPESEVGRWPSEGPQRRVQLTRGFWLGSTPVTQAFWEAVTGENPSRFKPNPSHPVEQVSWQDCQGFLMRFREAVPGFQAALPTEAQWEYACRAGTQTSTYVGDVRIVGRCNAPGLSEIAWYAGNSGVDEAFPDAEDSSEWPEKQEAHTRAASARVGMKRPNGFGLFDMLGNVWEWCEDATDHDEDFDPNPYPAGDVIDPAASRTGAGRVVRGGSWYSFARIVRSASRDARGPGIRDGGLGFRLAEVTSG